MVFHDYTADYDNLLSMPKRYPLLIVRLGALLVKVFKCVREINPIIMNMLFTLNSKPYYTRGGPMLMQSQVKTTKQDINSFVYQGAKQWYAIPCRCQGY